jgi:serine/threonine protein kinase
MTDKDHSATPSSGGTRRANALASGCMLDEYRIDAILGAGGFGVTYKAWDTLLETWVAIKEYFPVEWSYRDVDGVTVHSNTQGSGVGDNDERLSDYLWGLERFLDEARVLARVQHPLVVRVKRYFRAHGTAYIVMDYEEGEPLNAVLQEGETLDEGEVRGLLEDVLPALGAVHERGFLHRDIKPSNLYVRARDHRVMLIDFGAAREAVGRHSKSVTSLVTPGYSPPEQYTTRNDRYGSWTDVYALGAVLYRCVTGRPPVEAAERLLDDSLEPAVRAGAGRYGAALLRAIDRALAVRPEQRFATVAEMQAALDDGGPEEDGDQTVILALFSKPGSRPGQEVEAPRSVKTPSPAPARNAGGDELHILPPLDGDRANGQRIDVLRPQSRQGSGRGKLPSLALLGIGLILVALAVPALIWLWPFSAEDYLLPPQSWQDTRTQSAAISGSGSGSSTVAGVLPVATPLPVPAPVSSSTLQQPDAGPSLVTAISPTVSEQGSDTLGSAPYPTTATDRPTPPPPSVLAVPAEQPVTTTVAPESWPDQAVSPPEATDSGRESASQSGDSASRPGQAGTPISGRTPEPDAGSDGGILTQETAPVVKPQTATAAKPVAPISTASRTAARPTKGAKAPARPVRRTAGRKAAEARSGGAEPEPPTGEKPVSRSSAGNPWEAPTSTGFNQK